MSQSENVQIYEVQSINRGIWGSDPVHPWTNSDMENSPSWDEYRLPPGDWVWAGNWKIEKEAGRTDKDGWEYASKYDRYGQKGRKPKPEKLWNDKSRRRLWIRTMRREMGAGSSSSGAGGNNGSGRTLSSGGGRSNVYVSEVIDKVKRGLATIHKARMKIEQTMASDPDSVSAEKRHKLILSVSRNVEDVSNMLAMAEKKQQQQQVGGVLTNSAATASSRNTISMLSKLRRDCEKEKEAIELAFSRNQDQTGTEDSRNSDGQQQQQPQPQPHQFTMLTKANKAQSLNFPMPTLGAPPAVRGETGPGTGPVAGAGGFNSVFSAPGTPRLGVGGGGGFGQRVGGPVPRVQGGSSSGGSFSAGPGGGGGGGSKQAVHSGKGAGTFSLDKIVVQSSSDPDSALDGRDGHYMSEALQRRLIEKKLVGRDEATTMQEIIDERSDAIEEIYKGLVEVNKMFQDLSEMVKDNDAEIEDICKNINDSHDITAKGFSDIVDANRLQIEGGACTIS